MATPHIVALYQWLRGKPGVNFPVLSEHAFASEALDEANAESTTNQHLFLRHARVRAFISKRNASDVELEESVWFDGKIDYAGLNAFIGFINDQMTEEQQHPLQLTLNYLLIHPETATHPLEAFNTLFTAWMASNPIAAVTWYEDEATQEKLLSISQETHLAIGKVLVEHYLQESRELFKSIEHPIGLILLFAEHYDNPHRTAAFILCLLEQRTTPKKRSKIADKIIRSGLLHEFFLTHAGFMDSRDNPVTQLYGLLGTFEQGTPLVEKAHLISVMTQAELRDAQSAEQAERVSNKRYFESYALDGTEKHVQLEVIETRPVAFDAVPQPDYFNPFYRLFGQRFLLNLLNYYQTHHHTGVKDILKYQFNHLADDGLSARELVQLLNGLARENQASLLRAMAKLLKKTTINALIESDSFAVFHLIPFKPLLLDKLNLEQVQRYIGSIKTNDNPFDQLILLRTMLAQLQSRREASEITALVFDKMVDVLMSSPSLDDTRLIKTLRSVADTPRCKELLQQQAIRLATLLNQSIQAVMATPVDLTPDTLITLGDEWRSLSRKLNTLKEISPDLTSDFPHDKYAFYVSVVKAAVRAHEQAQSELKAASPDHQIVPFNLQATLSNLFPVVEEQEQLQNYPENSVSEHERTLIEVIAAIDNETLLAQAILLLEAPPIHRPDWTERDYGGHTIVELAAKKGNNRFIQYLFKENKLKSAAVSHLLKTAIAASQWDTVKQLIHLTGDNKPDIESVSEALVAATEAGQLDRLFRANDAPAPGFFPTQPNRIRLPFEQPASLIALTAAHGEEETVKQLIKLSPELLKSLVTRTHVIDYSGRAFTNISPFQYSLWAMDWHMWDMMLDSLQEAFNEGYTEAEAIRCEMLRQYKEIVDTHGVDYTLNGEAIRSERHFDLKPLIDALDTYVKNCDRWNSSQQEEHWCRVVGQFQRLVPAHVAQHYCEENPFDDKKPFRNTTLLRALRFRNWTSTDAGNFESWFPLTRDNRLGFDFAIYNVRGVSLGPWAWAGSLARIKDAGGDAAALSALLKARTQDFAELRELLATPLQKRDLGASYGVS